MSSKVVSSKENEMNMTEHTNEQLSLLNNPLRAALEARTQENMLLMKSYPLSAELTNLMKSWGIW